ncbi:ABC transporter ATP-binding protein/permease [Ponticaulis sp.]|uniref:ABCB family ABC transporter ATP-binding protein/permease n=1 Tax=Ponticaulis sp. TaxID=2020902 RepID=UPI000B6DC730|nr:ABC transporter ATP-binding protein/permease [Ponticaulis sp.]MAI92131.1 metal ABC transporter permease [Ponticaulis sp.]OUX96302.1 MAG: metal ABC transporter permease [Hyphomonadaceae bacterium TMED5]|tara:strand:+ start:103407 stop:105239 length:1833 start_codon:yes stop_codon:yes gene_type:complete
MRSHSPTDNDAIESASGGIGTALLRVVQVLWRPALSQWRFRMVIALIITVVAKGVSVAAPLFLGDAINKASDGEVGAMIVPVLVALGLFSGTRFMATALPQFRDILFAPVSQDAQRELAVSAFRKSQLLSLGFHQTRRSGALQRIIERGGAAMDVILRFLVFNIAPTVVELVLASIVLATVYSPVLSLIAIATIVVYVVFTVIVTEWRAKQRRELNKADTELRARAMDSLTNFETVKSFAAEARETESYDTAYRSYADQYVETSRSLAVLNTGQELIMNLGLFAMVGWTSWDVTKGNLEVGALAAVFTMLLNLYRPLNILGWGWREIRQGVIDLEKVFGLMGMVPEVDDRPGADSMQAAEGRIRFDHVEFSHDGRETGVDDVSFDLDAGQHLAIVGPSGAGKSTLLKLLFRFYDVSGGAVVIDGQDIRDVTQQSLREGLGIVPQDVVLFNDTIRSNILYGRPDAGDEDVRAAAAGAQLLDFIESLPNGWETRVGERGLKLSGGEKQRVGLARVILKNPSILLLDEATSALDSQTETRVQEAIAQAAKGRTTVIVAHRLSTIMHADKIIVLRDGRVVESGNHQELLAQNGLYSDMWSKQVSRNQSAETEPT